MSGTDDGLMWRGKLVDEMTREEAIEALKQCARLYQQSLERNVEIHDSHRKQLERKAARE